MAPTRANVVIGAAWEQIVRADAHIRGRWLSDAKLADLLLAYFKDRNTQVDFTVDYKAINRYMSTYFDNLDDFTETNVCGVFRIPFYDEDLSRRVTFYYSTLPGGSVEQPYSLDQVKSVTRDDQTRNPSKRSAAEDFEQQASRRVTPAQPSRQEEKEEGMSLPSPIARPALAALISESYWDSPEAKKLFLTSTSDSRSVEVALNARIDKLRHVNKHGREAWRAIVETHDKDNRCIKEDIKRLQQKSLILCRAYQIALDNMNEQDWTTCCTEALNELNPLGITAATNPRTVMEWNTQIRKNERLPHPRGLRSKDEYPCMLLRVFPEVVTKINKFCIKNLHELKTELVRAYLINTIIPGLTAITISDDDDGEDSTNDEDAPDDSIQASVASYYQTSPPDITTLWRWMKAIGWKYEKDSFRKLVRECLDRTLITKGVVRKMSRRARNYICAYHAIANDATTAIDQPISLPDIEKMTKKFKTHRSALDFGANFVNLMIREAEERR